MKPIERKIFPINKKNLKIPSVLKTTVITNQKINNELTPEEEKVAFLYTSKINSTKIFANELN